MLISSIDFFKEICRLEKISSNETLLMGPLKWDLVKVNEDISSNDETFGTISWISCCLKENNFSFKSNYFWENWLKHRPQSRSNQYLRCRIREYLKYLLSRTVVIFINTQHFIQHAQHFISQMCTLPRNDCNYCIYIRNQSN